MLFDPLKHHIGLAEGVDPAHGYVLEAPYRQDVQKTTLPSEFGGTSDQLGQVPSFSRWTQDDFLGGQYGYTWGEDNRQFARCVGMIPSQIGKSLRTIPPLNWWDVGTEPLEADSTLHHGTAITDGPAKLMVYGDCITRVSHDKIERWLISDGSYSKYSILVDGGSADTFWQAATLDRGRGMIWMVRRGAAGGKAVYRILATGSVAGGPTLVEALSGTNDPNALGCFGWIFSGGSLYGAWGPRELWVTGINDNLVDLTWTEAGGLDGTWRDAVAYNGLTYILLADDQARAKIVVYDGTDVLPLVDFPFNFYGRCIETYGGRLYVGGAGKDVSGDDAYAELYEITGSSLRLVRTFAPESRSFTPEVVPTTIENMHVHEGLLYLGTDMQKLLAYDVTTDSFYGGPWMNADFNPGLTKHIFSSRGALTVLVNEQGSLTQRFMRIGEATGFEDGLHTFETSDFQPEPATDKRWSMIHVHTRYGGVESMDYSVDGGASWTALAVMSVQDGDFWHNEAELMDIGTSTRIRFRWTFNTGTELEGFYELVSFTLRFLMLDSNKHAWAVTVLAVDRVEGVDGETIAQDVDSDIARLKGYATTREQLTFTDLDGQEYNVIVRDASLHRPEIGPPGVGGEREALMNVTLVEV